MMVGPIRPRPKVLAIGGALARAISCQKMTCCIRFAPRPPYCLGQETPAHPPSNNLRCHVRRYSKRDSSDSSRRSAQSVGTLAVSQERNSSRNCVSSDVTVSCIPPPEVAAAPSYFFRSSVFSTFPVAVFANASQNSIERGHL